MAIIVADDEEAIREVVGRCLEEAGHTVSYAATGDQVVKLLAKQHCDLVVADVLMPNGDGLDVIFAVKRTYPDTRVLAISGGGKYMVAPECLRIAKGVGADAVLLKPFGRLQLLAATDTAMRA